MGIFFYASWQYAPTRLTTNIKLKYYSNKKKRKKKKYWKKECDGFLFTRNLFLDKKTKQYKDNISGN